MEENVLMLLFLTFIYWFQYSCIMVKNFNVILPPNYLERPSLSCAFIHINNLHSIYMYSTKYLPMYPQCISITSPDKGHTSSTPRGQYFQPNFRDPQRVPKAQCSQVLVIIWPLDKMSIFGVHPPIFSIGTGLSVLMQSSFDHFV